MLFQTWHFALFFSIVTALFYSIGLKRGKIVLLLASYYFYATWNAAYVVMLLAITAIDYVCAIAIDGPALYRKRILVLGVVANLALLGTLKYANFAIASWTSIFGPHQHVPVLDLLVPLGISFHTFQSISYLVDVYRGKMRAIRAPLDYALYLAFFPQLVSGPIVRAELFFRELAAWQRPSAQDMLDGLASIVVGLVKKTVVADQFAVVANAYFGNVATHPGAPAAWSGAFAFAIQIYFDFSGYTDIVIGLARILGFAFPQNFVRPYLANSLTDFWHRWHITLSTWLRDYVYIPLGGSRGGELATIRNLLLTMLLGGLWHGASWTFVGWGAFHGVLLALERLTGRAKIAANLRVGSLGWALSLALTFALVTIGWVFFRAQTFETAFAIMRAMFAGGAGPVLLVPWQVSTVALFFGFELWVELRGAVRFRALPAMLQVGVLAGFALALELLGYQGPSASFIYFRF